MSFSGFISKYEREISGFMSVVLVTFFVDWIHKGTATFVSFLNLFAGSREPVSFVVTEAYIFIYIVLQLIVCCVLLFKDKMPEFQGVLLGAIVADILVYFNVMLHLGSLL